jgi:hypothetical protein
MVATLIGESDKWTADDRMSVLRAISDAKMVAEREWEASGQRSRDEVDPLAAAVEHGCSVKIGRINRDGVSPDDKGWVSGALRYVPGHKLTRVVLESRDPLPRQRFSLAHEFAHILRAREGKTPEQVRREPLAEVRRPNDRADDDAKYCSEKPDEYFADLFAHMFLVPSAAVRAMGGCGTSVEDMATRFKVTVTTMRRRLEYLGFEEEAQAVT